MCQLILTISLFHQIILVFPLKNAVRISWIPLCYLAFVLAFFSKTRLFSVKIRETRCCLVLTVFRASFIHKTRRKRAKIRGQNGLIPPIFSAFAQCRAKLERLSPFGCFVRIKPRNGGLFPGYKAPNCIVILHRILAFFFSCGIECLKNRIWRVVRVVEGAALEIV